MTPMAVGELGDASREHNERFRLKFYPSLDVVEERRGVRWEIRRCVLFRRRIKH